MDLSPEPTADVPADEPSRRDSDTLSAQLADDLARLLETEALEPAPSPAPAPSASTPQPLADPPAPEAQSPLRRPAPVEVRPPPATSLEDDLLAATEAALGGDAEPVPALTASRQAEPEQATESRPVETKAPDVRPPKPSEPDLSSLEDEMARLLDELAGDSKR
jgi:hypothetical protein